MNDYIERKSIIDAVREVTNDPNCPIFISATIEQILTEAPSAPVRLDVQGKWGDQSGYITTSDGSIDIHPCSNCGEDIVIADFDNFCPNCGARME